MKLMVSWNTLFKQCKITMKNITSLSSLSLSLSVSLSLRGIKPNYIQNVREIDR